MRGSWILRALLVLGPLLAARAETPLDASTLRGKVLCGYQAWFRCPGDESDAGWVHWSRDSRQITRATLTFELWPDLSGFPAAERYAVPGFSDAAGQPAYLYSAENLSTIRRHFGWMREYGLDGVWLQHFLVDLPGGPQECRFPSRRRVVDRVAAAAQETGRVWAIAFDIAGLPSDRIFEVLIREWKRMVDEGLTAHPRYLHQDGRPAVQIWGFYFQNRGNAMTAELAQRLIEFFATPGPYAGYLVGGGDWDWRRNPDPAWAACFRRFSAYAGWNVGNTSRTKDGLVHASTGAWAEDRRELRSHQQLWIPVLWPGFGWDNLKQQPPGSTAIPRRGGQFLWEQFLIASQLQADSLCLAMFDEVDEGTALFKVTNSPPIQGHFQTYEGLPSDWYLRLVGEATRRFHAGESFPEEIPLRP